VTAPTDQQAPPQGVDVGQVATYALEAAVAAKAAQMAIRAALMRDVAKLWPALDKARLAETFPGWLRAMSLLITNYHGQSSAAAGRFYQSARAQALGSPTPPSLIKAAPAPDPEWIAKAVGFSGPGMLSKDTAAPNTALSTTLGTASRIALDGGRTTVLETVKHDRAAVGWYRVTDGDPCAFCALLASRHIAYRSQKSSSFEAHNDCGCTGAPAFSREQELPPISGQAETVYLESTRGLGGKARMAAFRKAWAEHQSDGAQ
jgi:hypothetical protein